MKQGLLIYWYNAYLSNIFAPLYSKNLERRHKIQESKRDMFHFVTFPVCNLQIKNRFLMTTVKMKCDITIQFQLSGGLTKWVINTSGEGAAGNHFDIKMFLRKFNNGFTRAKFPQNPSGERVPIPHPQMQEELNQLPIRYIPVFFIFQIFGNRTSITRSLLKSLWSFESIQSLRFTHSIVSKRHSFTLEIKLFT